MKLPPSLQSGDRAIILSPAGNIDENVVRDAVAILESWGLVPETGENALCENGRFSGSVEERMSDLQRAFDDPSVRLVFCSRGGYGVVHMLNKLNYSGIKRFPKWVVGFSDITALHAALQVNGIASVHGPMAKHLSDEGAEDEAVRYMRSLLFGESVEYRMPVRQYDILNRRGTAEGRLFGGNLSVFCALMGTKFVKIPNKGILFIEDIGEAPYRVDRMIYQLKLSGVFEKTGGLIVGQFTGYEEDARMYSSLQESIFNAVREYDFPVCFDFPVGHVKQNYPLIMGEHASLNIGGDYITFIQ
ncbi:MULTISPECIES: S66 peptidase family protein [unclassified Proteiniphilum]|jgi:muramoyltetrapeptide carboxypeptidase|uniref:S66 peptidase family protein n=1 Tax=unclassified Proteiniphilum TaxID=2622718 RepID=UPI00257CCE5D|nr:MULTISPECIES: LD-carboxypeptidase [unclassified Proteiniphilum]